LNVGGKVYRYFSLNELKDERLQKLPYSIRVLLEAAIRNCDDFNVKGNIFCYIFSQWCRKNTQLGSGVWTRWWDPIQTCKSYPTRFYWSTSCSWSCCYEDI